MTRIENLNKPTKWTDPTKGQRPQTTTWMDPNTKKSTKWTDPMKGQDPIHDVDGPNKGQKLKQVHEGSRP